jgi:RND family efflux transporter MFP subunit
MPTQIEDPKQPGESLATPNEVTAPNHSHGRWPYMVIALLLVAAVLVYGMWSRLNAERSLRTEISQTAITPVSIVLPQREAPDQDIILPGNVQPYITSPIYSQTTGYLKKWYFDIGAHVRKGQLLAVIEAPAVDQQLEQARSNLLTAQANLALAAITKTRYERLLKSKAVSQQDADNAAGTYNANKAIVAADQAAVQEYAALVSFEKIYAPFDGVITARNTDIGDLIDSGSSGGVKTDLFHIAQTGVLRVYVNVPEEYSRGIKVGMTAKLALAEFPAQDFEGEVVRTADAINMTTRTLLTEVDVDNPTGTLLTGSYAEVHFAIPTPASNLIIPTNTLIFRSQGLCVGIVRNGKVLLTRVTPGHDFGNQIEIVTGLKPDDPIIVNPPDSIIQGQQVHVVQATLPGDSK